MVGCLFFLNEVSIEVIVILWVIIGIGDNLIYGAGAHILKKKDHDHKEDGSYIALQSMVGNIWYIILPMILWGVYALYWFTIAMSLMVIPVVALGTIMIILTLRK